MNQDCQANLQYLFRTSPEAASVIAKAEPGQINQDDGSDATEVDTKNNPFIFIIGFQDGRYVTDVAKRIGAVGFVMVYEPNLPSLRAALEAKDFTKDWSGSNVSIVVHDDAATLAAYIRGVEGWMLMGSSVVVLDPSIDASTFFESLAKVSSSGSTKLNTTMQLMGESIRNSIDNLEKYVQCDGMQELQGSAKGKAGIVVSAGPSLSRNVEQLKEPKVSERCVVVAVQTVLKPLLARGIRPQYVTSLDYSPISARFYEGLSESDVDGITLICEAKVHPSVPSSFPGRIRFFEDLLLDDVLGNGFLRTRGRIEPGSTVSHMSYYVARYLGCDPVILIGQDLAYTDGAYYGPGAAIHNSWSCELNEFNTLEMMEWQRIKRMGSFLSTAKDHLGRPVYTDDQMLTYLNQFERDFRNDAANGLTVIDATEGGLSKHNAKAMTFAQALASL